VSRPETKYFIYSQCPSRVCGFSDLCPEIEFGNRRTKQKIRQFGTMEAEVWLIRGITWWR